MDIDFPLVLTWAVLVCGAVWLFDLLLLKPRRQRAAASLESSGTRGDQLDRVLAEPRLVEYARSFFPVLLVVLVLRSFLAEPYQIPSESMLPSLEIGDFILVNKYAYGLRLPVLGTKFVAVGEPQRGDIMVFIPPHDPRYFIKRVIGVPGDRIRYDNKTLYINGERASYELVQEFEVDLPTLEAPVPVREYLETFDGDTHPVYRYPVREPAREWVVPEDAYFMMGDNRGRSEDSRVWGFASADNIVGKAVAIWMHKEPGLALPTFSRNRWLD
ncbi:MAG: signal peptidase I [Pseudomonadales bacterium]